MLRRDVPCKGCILLVPEADAGPVPLLVALHGDSHDAGEMLAAWQGVASAHGVALFLPTCPADLGCPGGSWWRWFQSKQHDAGWLSRQLDAVRSELAVDPARVYATGYSGGSSYLGFWAPSHSAELAAVGYVSGGYPYADTCGTCKLPVRAVIGAADGMLGPYVKPLLAYYEACGGHDVSTRIVPSLGHKGMLAALPAGEAERLWSWLSSHEAQCLPAAVPDAGLPRDASAAPVAPAAAADASIPAEQVTRPASHGCGCDLAPAPGALPALVLAVAWIVALGRRRARRASHANERGAPGHTGAERTQ